MQRHSYPLRLQLTVEGGLPNYCVVDIDTSKENATKKDKFWGNSLPAGHHPKTVKNGKLIGHIVLNLKQN